MLCMTDTVIRAVEEEVVKLGRGYWESEAIRTEGQKMTEYESRWGADQVFPCFCVRERGWERAYMSAVMTALIRFQCVWEPFEARQLIFLAQYKARAITALSHMSSQPCMKVKNTQRALLGCFQLARAASAPHTHIRAIAFQYVMPRFATAVISEILYSQTLHLITAYFRAGKNNQGLTMEVKIKKPFFLFILYWLPDTRKKARLQIKWKNGKIGHRSHIMLFYVILWIIWRFKH